MLVQALPSGEVWIWKDRPYAASQLRVICVTVAVAPRSTWIHCGSEKADAQRVPALPSTAALAGKVAFSVDEAVAGLPCEMTASAALAAEDTVSTAAIRVAAARAAVATCRRRPRGRSGGGGGGAAAG